MKFLISLIVIILGATIAQFIPNDWLYIFGFTIGCIVQAILSFE